MAITVCFQNLNGKKYRQVIPRDAELNRLLPQFDDASFPLIRLIDPYGSTLFSSLQMYGFLPEWSRLVDSATSEKDREILLEIQLMAEECKGKPHTFIHFIGD